LTGGKAENYAALLNRFELENGKKKFQTSKSTALPDLTNLKKRLLCRWLF